MMAARRKYHRSTISLRREAVKLYEQGAGSPKEIADTLQVSLSSVQKWILAAGARPNWTRRRNVGRVARERAVRQLVQRETTVDEVCQELGLQRRVVLQWLNRAGYILEGRRNNAIRARSFWSRLRAALNVLLLR